jgi:hypothetical protein
MISTANRLLAVRAGKLLLGSSVVRSKIVGDLSEDDHCRKNQKLFSKTSAQTADQERGSFATLSGTKADEVR